MKFIYPAVIRKQNDGTYFAFMPDLACCEATGDSIDEVMDNINEAAFNWLESEFEEDEPFLPPVSDGSDLKLREGDLVRNVSVTMRFFTGWDE